MCEDVFERDLNVLKLIRASIRTLYLKEAVSVRENISSCEEILKWTQDPDFSAFLQRELNRYRNRQSSIESVLFSISY